MKHLRWLICGVLLGLLILLPLATRAQGDERWADFFQTSGVDGDVRAVAVDGNGNLYAGGSFTAAGSVTVNRIAKWDGVNWSPLALGLGSTVYALAADTSGNLYAGGGFTAAGGSPANFVAKWDGAAWLALDSGVGGREGYLTDPYVSALALDSSAQSLYVGGHLVTAGDKPSYYIARWNTMEVALDHFVYIPLVQKP